MVDIYIDPASHDIEIINGRVRPTQTVAERIRQKLSITLKAFRGEWFRNISFGVPYLQNDNNNVQLIGKNKKDLADVYIREAILGVPGVTRISYYKSEVDNMTGNYKLVFEVKADNNGIETNVPFEDEIII